jgi:hypothetical protein
VAANNRGQAAKTTVKKAKEKAVSFVHANSLFKPEYGETVKELCKLGVTEKDLCLALNVSYNTLNDWKKVHPEFFVDLLKGKQVADREVAESLFKSANGYSYYEEVPVKLRDIEYDDKGKQTSVTERVEVVRVLKHKPAEVTAQIFWLKNRRPELWRDAKQIEMGPDLLKATQSGEPVLDELQKRGFVVLDGVYEVVQPETPNDEEPAEGGEDK